MKRALLLVAILSAALLACSEDDNPYWWLSGVREAGSVIPDTLILEASRDTTAEIERSTGSSQTLLVGRLGGVESVAFLRFTSLPDSADGIESGEIFFRVSRSFGEPVRLQLDAVDAGEIWDEDAIRWDTRPLATTLLDRTDEPVEWVSDTIATPDIRIPGNLIASWIEDSLSNGGIKLSVPEGEPEGVLEILSSEAVLDTGITIVNPPLTINYTTAPSSTHGPSHDAFVHNRFEGTAWGEDPTWIGVGGWHTRRALIGFDIESLRDSIQVGPTFSVAGATLLLTPLDTPPDVLPYVDSMRVVFFAVAEEPGWDEGEVISDSLPLETTILTLGDLMVGDEPSEFSLTNTVRNWIQGDRPNGGLVIASNSEISTLDGIRLHSRSDADKGPRLRIIVTRPAPVRLGVDP
jgi:hypothetical protein